MKRNQANGDTTRDVTRKIMMSHLTDVFLGKQSDVLQLTKPEVETSCCISVHSSHTTLHLQAATPQERDEFLTELKNALNGVARKVVEAAAKNFNLLSGSLLPAISHERASDGSRHQKKIYLFLSKTIPLTLHWNYKVNDTECHASRAIKLSHVKDVFVGKRCMEWVAEANPDCCFSIHTFEGQALYIQASNKQERANFLSQLAHVLSTHKTVVTTVDPPGQTPTTIPNTALSLLASLASTPTSTPRTLAKRESSSAAVTPAEKDKNKEKEKDREKDREKEKGKEKEGESQISISVSSAPAMKTSTTPKQTEGVGKLSLVSPIDREKEGEQTQTQTQQQGPKQEQGLNS